MNIICKKCGGEIYSKDDLIISRIISYRGSSWLGIPGSLKFFHKNCFDGERDILPFPFKIKVEKMNEYSINLSIFTGKMIFIFLFIPFLLLTFSIWYSLFAGTMKISNSGNWLFIFLFILIIFLYFRDIYKLMKIRDFIKK